MVRIVVGSICVAVGIVLLILPLIFGNWTFVFYIYGVPLFIIGIFILLNKKEDEIEKRKDIKVGRFGK
ncbi:MAG: hypothetical protein AABX48_01255 [Nanoarchaeota archaeon]